MKNYTNALTIEAGSAGEDVALLERSPFIAESLEFSTHFTTCEMSQREEVIVISGTIKVAP